MDGRSGWWPDDALDQAILNQVAVTGDRKKFQAENGRSGVDRPRTLMVRKVLAKRRSWTTSKPDTTIVSN